MQQKSKAELWICVAVVTLQLFHAESMQLLFRMDFRV